MLEQTKVLETARVGSGTNVSLALEGRRDILGVSSGGLSFGIFHVNLGTSGGVSMFDLGYLTVTGPVINFLG